jgi:predicted nucleic acid-binding protein
MKILFDTNVLIYAFSTNAIFHQWARALIAEEVAKGNAFINPAVLTEFCVGDAHPETVKSRLKYIGFKFLDLPCDISETTANAFKVYLSARQIHSKPVSSKMPLPDFFIGAHAATLGCALATADHQRIATYFPEVLLLTPYD